MFGCVLRRGVFIDSTTDIGRLENVHFNPHYWPRSGFAFERRGRYGCGGLHGHEPRSVYLWAHRLAICSSNCFVFAAKVGYHFIETPAGACNAQIINIGGDYCQTGLLIDKIQPIGLQITNGAFTSFGGGPNVGVATAPARAARLSS